MATALAQAGLNLFIAACLGASIGLERQWRQRLAGLRTNTLVALGAAIYITYARAVGDHDGATRMAAHAVTVGHHDLPAFSSPGPVAGPIAGAPTGSASTPFPAETV